MKAPRILLSAVLSLGPVTALFGGDVPTPQNFDRYKGMLDKPLFAVATAQAPPAATPNFAKDLYLANAAHLKDGDMITISSATDRNMKEYVSTNEPNDHGFKIISIEWSDQPGATKATIQKDGQVATLSFNQALMSQAPPPTGPNPPSNGAVVPGSVPPPPGYAQPRPAALPNMPTPPPRVRSVIQRTPSSAGANSPNGNNPSEVKE
jgi:hypothetical protein